MILLECDISSFDEEKLLFWLSLMSEEKRRRVDGYKSTTEKLLSAAGEMLIKNHIAEKFSVSPRDVKILEGKHGKPFVKDFPVCIGISHSAERTVCAVSDSPVGVDVERVRPIPASLFSKMLPGICPAGKIITDEALLVKFFTEWTARESYAKLLGVPLVQVLDKTGIKAQTIHKDGYVISICS